MDNGKINSDGSIENDYCKIYYDSEINDWVLSTKNKIGSTRIYIQSANGIKAQETFIIYYPIESPDFLKMQLVNFESFSEDQYEPNPDNPSNLVLKDDYSFVNDV